MKNIFNKLFVLIVFSVITFMVCGCNSLTFSRKETTTTSTTTKEESSTTKEIVTTTKEEQTTEPITETETDPITETDPVTETETETVTETEPITETEPVTDDITTSEGTTTIIHTDPIYIDNPTTTNAPQPSYLDNKIDEYSNNATLCDDGIVENIIYHNFQIHFIETGVYKAGDVIYIKAGEVDIIIDAGPSTSTISDITNYIDHFCTDGKIEYVIVTHSHSDHWAGMYGSSSSNNGILYKYKVDTIIHFAMTNKTSTASTTEYGKYLAAVSYAQNNGAVVYTAKECFNNENGASSKYVLDEENDISMTILYNYYYFNKSSDENNHSVCTLFSYKDNHYLLTGDLESSGEKKMAEYYDGTSADKTLPEVVLFKAGHHGSQTSSNEALLSIIKPKISVACCCAGSTEYTVNNDNIFPTQGYIDRISKYTDRVYVTSVLNELNSYTFNSFEFEKMNGLVVVSSNSNYQGLYASNNLIKLKDTEWFNEDVYIDSQSNIASGKLGSKLFYKYSSTNYQQDGLTKVKRRIWPSYE